MPLLGQDSSATRWSTENTSELPCATKTRVQHGSASEGMKASYNSFFYVHNRLAQPQ